MKLAALFFSLTLIFSSNALASSYDTFDTYAQEATVYFRPPHLTPLEFEIFKEKVEQTILNGTKLVLGFFMAGFMRLKIHYMFGSVEGLG
jgi:hypothetical protein